MKHRTGIRLELRTTFTDRLQPGRGRAAGPGETPPEASRLVVVRLYDTWDNRLKIGI